MEAIFDLLASYSSDEVILRRILVALSAATIFILGLGLTALIMNLVNPVRRRMGLVGETPEVKGRLLVRVATALGPVSTYLLPRKELERKEMTLQLFRAGFRSPQAQPAFYAIKSLMIFVLPLAVLLATRFFPGIETRSALTYAMFAAGFGLIAPNIVLRKLVARRSNNLRRAFPDALDLLVVCVEAGLGLAAAIQRVADELAVSHPELAFELSTVNAEIRAGTAREKALRNLADRTGLPDIRGLVGLLVQTMRFGTSISDALRVYSEEFRDIRMQRAEEQAAKMGTKLIFPLIFCMFPVFFIVAIGPAVLNIMNWASGP
ncbi:MAG: type II secretion system F family protein [Proteobacteria bacterium]|nr:type II secretion system F family protein [Pseudomonadota bacterium]